ncbi:FAD-linked oxidase-like protein [Trametes punicea]|nr:FAD-linked oxidase-like protein [Trametes punicea]
MQNPSVKALTFEDAAHRYGATFFHDALARFVIQYRQPQLSWQQIERASATAYFNFRSVSAFHKVKYLLDDVQGFGLDEQHKDVVHARPARQDSRGRPVPARFDTVLVNDGTGGSTGVTGYRVGQVRLIFKLPRKSHSRLFPDLSPPDHLAYVDWFTGFTQPDPVHGMYKVSRSIRARDGLRLASIIEVFQMDLWADRKNALLSAQAMWPDAKGLGTDVCVPVSRLPDLIYRTKEDLEEHGVPSTMIGQVGDGIFHALLLYRNEQEQQAAHDAVVRMVKRATALDGTCTGEHGVGIGKRQYLCEELGEGTVQLMKTIKNAIDPLNLFNPGKGKSLYPDEGAASERVR